jgi:uncharacterized secreted protein with C-terminal beta-propeller domain
MQVSVFDISDASAPRQVDRLSLGHGWSPALDDSRAFTYDPDRRLAAFVFAGSNPDGPKSQLSTAVGLQVAEDGSLTEAGRLELVPEAPAGRVLVDGSSLFAVGETGVVAGDAASWVRTGEVSFSDR